MDDFIRRSIERKRERNSRINGAMIRRFIKIARLHFFERWLYKKKKKEYERNAIKLRSFQLWPSGEVNTRGKLDGLHERTARALKSGRRGTLEFPRHVYRLRSNDRFHRPFSCGRLHNCLTLPLIPLHGTLFPLSFRRGSFLEFVNSISYDCD